MSFSSRDQKRLIQTAGTLLLLLLAAFGFTSIESADQSLPQEPVIRQVGTYHVASVVDGDTIKVETDGVIKTVRLIGIDTPETVDPRKPVQCFGKEASNKAKELMADQDVLLESDTTQGDTDKYQRLLRYVRLQDGTLVNQFLIEHGYAHEYTYDAPYKYQAEFKAAEMDAQANKRGLWSQETCNGITDTR